LLAVEKAPIFEKLVDPCKWYPEYLPACGMNLQKHACFLPGVKATSCNNTQSSATRQSWQRRRNFNPWICIPAFRWVCCWRDTSQI